MRAYQIEVLQNDGTWEAYFQPFFDFYLAQGEAKAFAGILGRATRVSPIMI